MVVDVSSIDTKQTSKQQLFLATGTPFVARGRGSVSANKTSVNLAFALEGDGILGVGGKTLGNLVCRGRIPGLHQRAQELRRIRHISLTAPLRHHAQTQQRGVHHQMQQTEMQLIKCGLGSGKLRAV